MAFPLRWLDRLVQGRRVGFGVLLMLVFILLVAPVQAIDAERAADRDDAPIVGAPQGPSVQGPDGLQAPAVTPSLPAQVVPDSRTPFPEVQVSVDHPRPATCPQGSEGCDEPAATPSGAAPASRTLARVHHVAAAPEPEIVAAVAAGLGLALLAALALRWAAPLLGWLYGFIPAAWRMERDAVLAHPTRRAVLDHLEVNPGATLMELAGAAEVRGTRAAYHLMILMREDLVSVRELDGRKLYFSRNAPRADLERVMHRQRVRTLAQPERTPGRVLAHVLRAPGATVSQLAKALDFAPGHAHYHLVRLAERGLLDRVRQGRRVRHYLTPRGRALVRDMPSPGAAPAS